MNCLPRLRPLIAHIIPWDMTTGGAQRFLAELATWAKPWAEVHVFCPRQGTDDAWLPLLAGCEVHLVDHADQVTAALRELQPDLIHHHQPDGEWGIRGLLGRVPMIGTPHGWNSTMTRPSWAVPICGGSPDVIRHGVDLELFAPTPNPHPSPLKPMIVGVIGRMHSGKIPPQFLAELAHWPNDGSIELRFYGYGLANLDAKRIEKTLRTRGFPQLMGDIPPEQMPDVYRDLDAVLIPSAQDSVSLVAIEAMASGLPVIARRIEGLPDTIGNAGLLFDHDSEIRPLLDGLAKNKKLRTRLAVAARKRAVALFGLDRMLANYDEAYARATAGLVRRPLPTCEVSVVMPVTDGVEPDWLKQAVDAIVGQEAVQGELIVISDGVTDEGLAMAIDAAAGIEGVTVLRQPERKGISAACNRAIRMAQADLIARADGDDIMPPGRLAAQVKIMRESPGVAVISGDMAYFHADRDDKPQPSPTRRFRPGVPLWTYWNGNWPIAHPTVCIRRYVVMKAGGYDESLPCSQDLDLWCRLQQKGWTIAKHDQIWNHYRIHPHQVTAQHDKVRNEMEMILAKYTAAAAPAPPADPPDKGLQPLTPQPSTLNHQPLSHTHTWLRPGLPPEPVRVLEVIRSRTPWQVRIRDAAGKELLVPGSQVKRVQHG